ncbi:ABC transporter substrate-binding protein [Natrononativus amylolyticus]|uniref:ABC transporter substrate-binding protein n=1 Tax=Natrononativus amylolyticus TaxID=2963434 RepID=UPI0020CF2FEE|nr:ABC transporter substrate-binding protein [Natrononativus amylolyticus]
MSTNTGFGDTVSRRRFLYATGSAAGAAAIAGCSGDDPEALENGDDDQPDVDGPDEEDGKVFRGINDQPDTLDPAAVSTVAGRQVFYQILETLVHHPNAEPQIEGMLAEDYELSDDGMTITLDLVEGVEFSDGRELTADDVVYTFERVAGGEESTESSTMLDDLGVVHETETVEEEGEEFDDYVAGSAGVTAVDEYTVEIELEEQFHMPFEFLAQHTFSILPEGYVGDVEGYDGEVDYEDFAQGDLVGTGPFVFDEWQPGSHIQISARNDYWGDGPEIQGAHWALTDDGNASEAYALALNSDQVSLTSGTMDRDLIEIEGTDDEGREYGTYGPIEDNGETVDYYRTAELNTYYLCFNLDRVPREVREAFAYAIDRQQFVEEAMDSPNDPGIHHFAPSIFPGGVEEAEAHAEENWPYGYREMGLDRAVQIMEDAGYDDDNLFEIELTTYPASGDLGEYLRDILRAAHIETSVSPTDVSVLLEQASNGQLDAFISNNTGQASPYTFVDRYTPTYWEGNDDDWRGSMWIPEEYETAQRARDAWNEINDNLGPSEEEEQNRAEAYLEIEEANWEEIVRIPMYYLTSEHMHYEWVDRPRIGSLRRHYQRLNTVEIGERP